MTNSKYILNFFLGLSFVLLSPNLYAQETKEKAPEPIPYGNNPEVGKYFDSEGVKLYYEVYGEGDPILMLHGGVFGYIDELRLLLICSQKPIK